MAYSVVTAQQTCSTEMVNLAILPVFSLIKNHTMKATHFCHQMDLAVFAELPVDIQKQLRQAMTERQRKKHHGDNVHRDNGQPGCSHWTSDQQHDGDVTEVTGGERSSEKTSSDLSLTPQPIVALPSYSQVRKKWEQKRLPNLLRNWFVRLRRLKYTTHINVN